MFFPLKKTIKGLEIWSNEGILRFELKLKESTFKLFSGTEYFLNFNFRTININFKVMVCYMAFLRIWSILKW